MCVLLHRVIGTNPVNATHQVQRRSSRGVPQTANVALRVLGELRGRRENIGCALRCHRIDHRSNRIRGAHDLGLSLFVLRILGTHVGNKGRAPSPRATPQGRVSEESTDRRREKGKKIGQMATRKND